MRLPRDISGRELIKLVRTFGYVPTRQKGSHIRLTTTMNGEHHITIPEHDSLRVGTLRSIIGEIASHLGSSVDVLASQLFPE